MMGKTYEVRHVDGVLAESFDEFSGPRGAKAYLDDDSNRMETGSYVVEASNQNVVLAFKARRFVIGRWW